jgi:hypothetical protein
MSLAQASLPKTFHDVCTSEITFSYASW